MDGIFDQIRPLYGFGGEILKLRMDVQSLLGNSDLFLIDFLRKVIER